MTCATGGLGGDIAPSSGSHTYRLPRTPAPAHTGTEHRSAGAVDLLLAAVAEEAGLTLLHYDQDFETITRTTAAQPVRRIDLTSWPGAGPRVRSRIVPACGYFGWTRVCSSPNRAPVRVYRVVSPLRRSAWVRSYAMARTLPDDYCPTIRETGRPAVLTAPRRLGCSATGAGQGPLLPTPPRRPRAVRMVTQSVMTRRNAPPP